MVIDLMSDFLDRNPREKRVIEQAKISAELGYPDPEHDPADDAEEVLLRFEREKEERDRLKALLQSE